MSRVFLMKWYHFTVEYFEDLRNVNHCEFLIMRKQIDSEMDRVSTLRSAMQGLQRTKQGLPARLSASASPRIMDHGRNGRASAEGT